MRRPQFTQLSPTAFASKLGTKLINPIDKVRNINAKLGLRPYRVYLVWTQWSGGARDVGVQQVLREVEILPVPKVSALSHLQLLLQTAGLDEQGTLYLSEITATMTEDMLRGRFNGADIPEDQSFYIEIDFFRGTDHDRKRFTPRSTPFYDTYNVQWTMHLLRANNDRSDDGTPEE